jgi:hypothetical protein
MDPHWLYLDLRLLSSGQRRASASVGALSSLDRHKRFDTRPHNHSGDTRPHNHSVAVRLLPNIMPVFGLADLEPTALGCSPDDCGQEHFNRAACFQFERHASDYAVVRFLECVRLFLE